MLKTRSSCGETNVDPDAIDALVKAAPAIAKGVTAVGAAIPFTGIVKRMLGPAADELAEMWRDQVRMYRYQRQVKLLDKFNRIVDEAGFTPQPVPPKILFPLLEGASFEDDENLHDMWSSLLANAASPENAGKVRPGFIATLKQMAPDEAVTLNWIFDQRTGPGYLGPFNDSFTYPELMQAYVDLGFSTEKEGHIGVDGLAFETCLQNLEAERLILPKAGVVGGTTTITPRVLTMRGLMFVMACRPPKPKANG
jgi:Abortive infection alpha